MYAFHGTDMKKQAEMVKKRSISFLMMTKNIYMFVQNHNVPVKHGDTGIVVSKHSCQNTTIRD